MSDLYDGELAYQDSWMGAVFESLESRGLLDKTVVIVTADHGENLGDHDLFGHKVSVYDRLLHVPLIIRLPDVVAVGTDISEAVENRHIWRLIDLAIRAWSEGRALAADELLSVLREATEGGYATIAERHDLTPNLLASALAQVAVKSSVLEKSIRINDTKLIWHSAKPSELYDVGTDPHELTDLSSDRPEVLMSLQDALFSILGALEASEAEDAPPLSEELLRDLRALGYVR